ncbi:tyrosine-protein kinase Fer-like [Dreissena polymorpha]|uniref:Protein kinase domain-containing protein n=1 Tax=Dreissena polymorpha TaxID=45954 RepID=A0A9D4GYX1_DREPO|nr:tyrosine-protein kinase Fer-like [Dreissena polymorpha]KAH3824265.1 hypothetical protein DPMN_126098 [Dreissena polymorpha]
MEEIQVDAVEWLSTLRLLEDEVCATEHQIEENMESNNIYKKAYMLSVEAFRTDIITRLDELVDKAIIAGKDKYTENDDTLNKLLNKCKDNKDTILKKKHIIKDLSQKKQHPELNIISKTLKNELQGITALIRQYSFENRIVKFSFENNSELHAFLLKETQDIGTLQEICEESDEVVDDEVVDDEGADDEAADDTPHSSKVALMKSKAPRPLPRKSVLKQSRTILSNQMEACGLNNDDILLETRICKIHNSEGCFELYRGVLRPSGRYVTIKTCLDTMSKEQENSLVREGQLIMQFDHPNIVKFIGIAEQRKPCMLIMENFSGGILLTHLQTDGENMTPVQKAKMCLDVANGMMYLSERKCIHRDIAARNCLLYDKNIVKISEFGSSKVGDEYKPEELVFIPVKWTAPEVFDNEKYTTMCDVWSYGVMMWEIFSNGLTPYPGMTLAECQVKVIKGFRMPTPQNTPQGIHKLMQRCWDANPLTRISFKEMYTCLETVVGSPSQNELLN